MTTARIDVLVWLLIYGGLIAVCLGVFVQRTTPALGWTFVVAGAVAACAGLLLIWFRSTVKETPP